MLGILPSYIVSRASNMVGCDTSRSPPNTFIAVCAVPAFADYEHAAFYRNMEPEAIDSLRKAAVVVMGDSRIQWAFSRNATSEFFDRWRLSYFLLGFGYVEQGTFPLKLMRKYDAHPKIIIVNVDPFFDDVESSAAIDAERPSLQTWADDEIKSYLPIIQGQACSRVAWTCGRLNAIYRSRSTGAWIWENARTSPVHRPIPIDVPVTTDLSAKPLIDRANAMIGAVGVKPSCVILTQLPNPVLDYRPLIPAIASATGASVVLPQIQGLSTLDGSHLDSESANRWMKDFYDLADPLIARCLEEP